MSVAVDPWRALEAALATELAEVAVTSKRCQRWHGRVMSWQLAAPGEGFDARRYEVKPVDEPTARAYIEEHHYSRAYPADKWRFGLYEGEDLVGVAVYGIPVNERSLTNRLPDLEPYVESIELSRLVLADRVPGNGETWMLARCHRELLAQGVRGVVSFADPVPRRAADGAIVAPGHVGWIYQALAGGQYTGRSTARTHWMLPNGTLLSPRTLQKIRKLERGHEAAEIELIGLGAPMMLAGEKPAAWLARALEAVNARKFRHGGCHAYVFPLGHNQRARNRVRIGKPAKAPPRQADPLKVLW